MNQDQNPGFRNIRTLRLLDSNYTVPIIMLLLMIVPYLMYDPEKYAKFGLFIFRPLVSQSTHIFFSVILAVVTLGSVWLTQYAIGRHRRRDSERPAFTTGLSGYALIGALISICLVGRLFIVFVLGHSYVQDGLIAARSDNVAGLGVVSNIFMFVVPLIIADDRFRRYRVAILLLFGIFSAAEIVILSARMALIEFIGILIVSARICRMAPSLKQMIPAIIGVYVLFGLIQSVRLVEQNKQNADLVSRGAGRTDLTIIAYYADTMNKAYYWLDEGHPRNAPNWEAPIAALAGVRPDQTTDMAAVISASGGATELNNPGGLSEDIHDFGPWFFLIIFAVRIVCFVALNMMCRVSAAYCALYPLMFVEIIEYPRFVYMELPFAAWETCLAMLTVVFLKAVGSSFRVTRYRPVRLRRRALRA